MVQALDAERFHLAPPLNQIRVWGHSAEDKWFLPLLHLLNAGHIYALFDRRCRTQTALDKLQKLRQWVNRFQWIGDTLKKVFAPTLEKALTLLDDKLLPATSNAVERGNRRHRKMQKSVYRVRSKVC